jgi:hypothetical protein
MSPTDLEQRCRDLVASLREAVGATRARLYTMDPAGAYRLTVALGFGRRDSPEETLQPSGPLLEWVRYHRQPVLANSLEQGGPLSALMEKERVARMLAAPVFDGSRLVGVLELRDRASGEPFTPGDLGQVQSAAARLAALLGTEKEPESAVPDLAQRLFFERRDSRVAFPPPPPLFHAAPETAPGAAPQEGVPPREGSHREVQLFKGFVHTLLRDPEIEAVVFSYWGSERAELYLGARRPFAERAKAQLLRSLEEGLASVASGTPVPREKLFNTEYVRGRGGEVESFAGVQTSLIRKGPPGTLLFSAVFGRELPPGAADSFREIHRLVRAAVGEIQSSARYRSAYRSLINALLEPAARSHPSLKAHGLAVGVLCRRLATDLRLPGETVEQVTVSGLLHDVGLRELDLPYERLAERRPLSPHEMAFVRRHPVIGAERLEGIEFPYPVAALVRYHHERWDGNGYPDRLSGKGIPLGSRIIALAEAFDAMTSADSYRPPISREDALRAIERESGSQFDPELAARFCEMLRGERGGG